MQSILNLASQVLAKEPGNFKNVFLAFFLPRRRPRRSHGGSGPPTAETGSSGLLSGNNRPWGGGSGSWWRDPFPNPHASLQPLSQPPDASQMMLLANPRVGGRETVVQLQSRCQPATSKPTPGLPSQIADREREPPPPKAAKPLLLSDTVLSRGKAVAR